MRPNQDLPLYAWILIVLVLLTQGIWLFINARKHGHLFWFWGIWGLIQFPLPLFFYYIFARKIFKRRN